MTDDVQLDPSLKKKCDYWVKQLTRVVKGSTGMVIASSDGYEISSSLEQSGQISRLAAMASSISALGSVVGKESEMGRSEFVLLQAEKGYFAVMSVNGAGTDLIIGIMATREAIAGQVLHFGNQCAKSLSH